MDPVIEVIGIGADGPAGLRSGLLEHIHAADFLAGGDRHLNFFPGVGRVRFAIKDNVSELLDELSRRYREQRCVVLATGDPLFFGIGSVLVNRLGSEILRIEPAVSSMQLAFARAGIPWQGAVFASVHGRSIKPNLLPLLGQSPIGLFTQDGDSPGEIAQFFLQWDAPDYEGLVAENLGTTEERIRGWLTLEKFSALRFAPLNYLILRRPFAHQSSVPAQPRRLRALVPGVPDEEFARPDDAPEVMTRQEVRSVVIGKLLGPTEPGDVVWDIGAGLGTVSVEIAVLRPHVEVVAVEKDAARREFLEQNRKDFEAWNVRVVGGPAPEWLSGQTPPPRYVFIGGSGGRLADILRLVGDRLREGGRLVASFVTLENLTLMLDRVRGWNWPFDVTEVHVSRSDRLAGLTGLNPQRGVFIVRADRPREQSGE